MKTTAKNTTSRQTQQRIKQAFAELIQEQKSVANFNVSQLAERAGITRATFYRYYDNLNQVVDDFQQELTQAFFSHSISPLHPREIDAYLDHLTLFLKQHENSYRLLLASPDTLSILNQISHRLSQNLYSAFHRPHDKRLWLDVNFFVAGITTLLLRYFRNEINLSLDEINFYIKQKFRQTFLLP